MSHHHMKTGHAETEHSTWDDPTAPWMNSEAEDSMKQKQLLEVFHLQVSMLFVPASSLLQHWGLGMDRVTLASPFLQIPSGEGKKHKGQLFQKGKSPSTKNKPCKKTHRGGHWPP